MLRFRIKDDNKTPRMHRGKKSRDKRSSVTYKDNDDGSECETDANQYIDVDVGTPTRLRVVLDEAVAFRCIHTSLYSKLFQIQRIDGDSEVLVVRWMDPTCSNSDKDDVAISMVPDDTVAPTYQGKKRYMHEGAYVSVGIRKYIHGEPLSKVIRRATPAELDHYKLQVSSIISDLATVTSDYYGTILDGNLKTSTLAGYISAHNMIEKLRNRDYTGSVLTATERNWNHDAKPRLCHGSLWPEHIIVKGTSVEGIVGWSNADFVSESLDRYTYELWSVNSRTDQRWRTFLQSVPSTDEDALTPTARRDMIKYAQAMSMSKASRGAARAIERHANSMLQVDMNVEPLLIPSERRSARISVAESVNNARLSVAESVSDAASLATLTDQTIDTWEQFTVTTESTAKP
jgi:hypothetical protein